jgi:2-polyprenyl-3-methyl-5-hydroxy-6-metoxy-1,4-benzoquinol methylase
LYNFRWLEKIKPSKYLIEIFQLQFYNFFKEKQISLSINTISNITNNVSIKVKKQYEENPYPRWTNLGLSIEARDIKDVVNDIKLNINLNQIQFSKNPEILIAGCGTGQHVITTASKYKNVRVYALDLSFNSLSYAKRKAMELGIKNINFIQGDILNINALNKKFDLIESVGVLHRMEIIKKLFK